MNIFDAPLHPMLVHFPIALFLSAWILEVPGRIFKNETLHKAAMCIYTMAAFSSLFTVASGLWEANRLHLKHPILYAHRNYALAALLSSWVSVLLIWFFHRSSPRTARVVFTCACWVSAGLIMAAGYFGGKMVYGYGIGVNP